MFARTLRTTFAAALLALSVVPAAAFASPADTGAKTGDRIHQEKREEKGTFPKTAAEFRAHMDKRIAKSRERLIARMNEKKLPAAEQKERLVKFDEATTRVNKKVDEVCADGTVTKEEAREVHKVAHQLGGKHGEHKKGDKGEKGAARR